MRKIIDLTFPVSIVNFDAKYSKVTTPTGIEYLLLTMISNELSNVTTWSELIKLFSIPEDIHETIFKPALEKMSDMGMIVIDGAIGLYDDVSNVSLSPVGKNAYENKVITEKPEDISGNIIFFPARNPEKRYECYLKSSPLSINLIEPTDTTQFEKPDQLLMENCIEKNKKYLNIKSNEMKLFGQSFGDVSNKLYVDRVGLIFKEQTGDFEIDAPYLDTNYIKRTFSGTELLGQIDLQTESQNRFIPSNAKWRDSVPPNFDGKYIFPKDFVLSSKERILVNKRCFEGNKHSFDSKNGCDIITLNEKGICKEYYLINKSIQIYGLEGTIQTHVVAFKTANKKDSSEIIADCMNETQVNSISDFEEVLGIIETFGNNDLIKDCVIKHLESTEHVSQMIQTIKKRYEKQSWVDTIIEETLAKKRLSIDDLEKILDDANINVECISLARNYKSDSNDLNFKLADVLLNHSKNDSTIVNSTDVREIIVDCILNNKELPQHKSQYMICVENTKNNLAELKEIFTMNSLRDYDFDLSEFDKDRCIVTCDRINNFKKDYNYIRVPLSGSDSFTDLENYCTFFEKMSITLKQKTKDNVKLNDKTDDRLFGILAGIKLSDALTEICESTELGDMLKEAHEKGMINDNSFAILDEFRKFRNGCAHKTTIDKISKQKKNKWLKEIDLIADIDTE